MQPPPRRRPRAGARACVERRGMQARTRCSSAASLSLYVGEVPSAGRIGPGSPALPPAEMQPEPEPEQHLNDIKARWWQELELEEIRQDLCAAEQQPTGDNTSEVSMICQPAADQVGEVGLAPSSTSATTAALGGAATASQGIDGSPIVCLSCRTPAQDRFQSYSDAVAWDRWHTEKPLRIVDYELGFPVVIEEPNGYPRPPPV